MIKLLHYNRRLSRVRVRVRVRGERAAKRRATLLLGLSATMCAKRLGWVSPAAGLFVFYKTHQWLYTLTGSCTPSIDSAIDMISTEKIDLKRTNMSCVTSSCVDFYQVLCSGESLARLWQGYGVSQSIAIRIESYRDCIDRIDLIARSLS